MTLKNMGDWRVAIVVQRYGEEVGGGAELHARWLAEHLLAVADVHAITTCALDYYTWANHYPAGESHLSGVTVHRFPVDRPRDWRAFQKLTGQILRGSPSPEELKDWIKHQGPFSTPLFDFVKANEEEYDTFIFFTYLYAPTFFGLPLVSNKAILVPTAHDEPYLYLPIFHSLFHLPRTIVYNTNTEKALVNRVTGNGDRTQDIIAGIGINVPDVASAERFRANHGVHGDFLLYVGRIDESKNVPELLDHFTRYNRTDKRGLNLVLVGKVGMEIPDHPRIRALGFLDEQDKFDAIKAASVAIIPSLYESLSMATLEAWLMETPVLVNGRCEVLRDQCRASNGGLYYVSYEEFAATLSMLVDSPQVRNQLGRNGRAFVEANYDWQLIIEKYRTALVSITDRE